MNDCVFCQIVAGQIPCHKVYEDDLFLGFLDINPRAKGHTLLIPKKHYRWSYDVPQFDQYWLAVLKIIKAMQKVLNSKFVSYGTHGLEITHAHIHIFPRRDEVGFFPEVKKIPEAEMREIAQKIRGALEKEDNKEGQKPSGFSQRV